MDRTRGGPDSAYFQGKDTGMAQPTGNIRRLFDALKSGAIDRRQFISRTTALGLGASMSLYLANAAAQTPAASPTSEGASGGGGLPTGVPRAEAPEDQERGAGGELRILQWQAPSHLLGHQASGDKDTLASCLVTEPLMYYGVDGGLLANLVTTVPSAENGDLADDLTGLTLRLLEGVTWSDGEPFTAHDVEFTHRWVTNPENSSTSIEIWQPITEMEVVDDHTINVTFEAPNPLWYQPFTGNLLAAVLPRHILEDADQETMDNYRIMPIGTGPYVVTDMTPNDEVRYEVNENYREPNKPYFSSVYLKGGGEPAAAARAVLQTGEYHYAWFLGIDADLLLELEQGGEGKLLLFSQGYAERLHLNHSDPNTEVNGQRSEKNTPHPFLSDPDVRKAMALGINRQLIVDELYIPDSIEEPAKDIFTGISSLESPNTELVYDPEQAEQLLEDAGWVRETPGGVRSKDGVELSMVFMTTTNQLRQRVQSVVKANLEEIGFLVDIQNIDGSIYFDSSAGNDQNVNHMYHDFNMHQTSAGAPTPIRFVQRWYAGPDGENIAQAENDWSRINQVRYQNEEYDALFEELRVETDATRQIELFIEMNDHLIDNNALIPMVAVAERSAAAGWLNEEAIQLGPFNLDYWNIANWYGDQPV